MLKIKMPFLTLHYDLSGRMTYTILIANVTVKLSKRLKARKQYLWILIAMYYLLSKNWVIFATRCRISLIINIDYLRGG